MLVPLESSSAVFVTISSKSVSICNRFQASDSRLSYGEVSILPGLESVPGRVGQTDGRTEFP